ncbi:hypothetical protein [Serratia fonticola]|uniref:hypothetical protein n=1 Tax=Serratia fonticola TaxID=47917 RepID=UPI0021B77717|nr:hypothetical protein [Serratia fonticola]
MSVCNNSHVKDPYFSRLPKDQGGFSRHKCAGCAYEVGYKAGLSKQTVLDLESAISPLPESQKDEVRHKSPLVAFAQGYTDGLLDFYEKNPAQR